MSFSEMFYANVLPIMTLAAFLYIIYLLFFREAHFDKIEEKFERAIRKNMESSENIINIHFDKSQDILIGALNRFSQEAREELNETLNNIKTINENLSEVVNNQKALNNSLSELQEANAIQADEIRKRDAIIERKTKQIQRLKNAIYYR